MYEPNREKTIFMTEQANYQYRLIPFILKNEEATCQMMMHKVFMKEICEKLEVYMDDMIIISSNG